MEDDGFTLVKSNRKNRKGKNTAPKSREAESGSDRGPSSTATDVGRGGCKYDGRRESKGARYVD